ncbi:hypothetical protein TCAL_09425 [Tigriopus californicus]|uniref:Uncharacterized protein n=1 Tax=Tigriopus californicus TaxID=6832 RepID=A0A553P0E4_TIGCA|nr:hypothetical protein TCAL_09425 [Tigriopus californicus]|eukprot:TCALIF_09425-PA protein Name:"Protein of unknown function" AED:0.02 eAED:0.02 QI:0/1/0.66/1/0/0.33/3/0/164
MKTYTLLAQLFSTIVLVGCARAQSQDRRSALPKILRSMDRADLADPLFTLRNFVAKSTQIDPSKSEQEAKIKQLQDLEPWKRSKLRALIDQDADGILKKSLDMAKNEPISQLLASRDLEDYILRHVIAPITPVYGVSETCFSQSMEYAKHLFINATPWAYQSEY